MNYSLFRTSGLIVLPKCSACEENITISINIISSVAAGPKGTMCNIIVTNYIFRKFDGYISWVIIVGCMTYLLICRTGAMAMLL